MSTSPRVIEEDDVMAFLESVAEWPDDSRVARRSLWQLSDFDFEQVAHFEGDVSIGADEAFPFGRDWLEARGVQDPSLKTLIVVEGSVRSEQRVSPDYLIVRGDLTCPALSVDGESLLVCFGTCVAAYVESTYNGVISSIRAAQTGFVFLSRDEVLAIHEVVPRALVFGAYDAEVVAPMFRSECFDDGAFTHACMDAIEKGEPVLVYDAHAILEQVARLQSDPEAAANALASLEGVAEFRFWEIERSSATVLHALATVDAPEPALRGAVRALVGAGVPLDHEGKKMRFGAGVGTALHTAVVEGRENAARALAAEGASVDTGGGRLMQLVLNQLEYDAEYPERSTAADKEELLQHSVKSLALAEELGYRVFSELRSRANSARADIERALKAGKNRTR